jgi:serine O-acetyltransferase
MFFKRIQEDIDAYKARDPAARSSFEVALLYQGFHSLMFYRLSHAFWVLGAKCIGRFISQIGRLFTGIEIHPGAVIGRGFVVDHGIGVVIGETTVIGDNVTLYHDVTLGGVAPSVDSIAQIGVKRHPTLLDGVIVGSGAQILGPIVIGEDARVGANAVVTASVPSGVTAVGIPARVILPKNKKKSPEFWAYATDPDGSIDPVLQTIESLCDQVSQLMERVQELEADGVGKSNMKQETKSASVDSVKKKKSRQHNF